MFEKKQGKVGTIWVYAQFGLPIKILNSFGSGATYQYVTFLALNYRTIYMQIVMIYCLRSKLRFCCSTSNKSMYVPNI